MSPDENSPLAYVVSDVLPPVPFQGEGSVVSSDVLESVSKDVLPIERGKRKTARIQAAPKGREAWSQHKDEIRRLYIEQGRSLPRVMSALKKRGFDAT